MIDSIVMIFNRPKMTLAPSSATLHIMTMGPVSFGELILFKVAPLVFLKKHKNTND